MGCGSSALNKVHHHNQQCCYALHKAACRGNVDTIERLIKSGCWNVDEGLQEVDVIERTMGVKKRISLSSSSLYDSTPLHLAALCGHVRAVEALVKAGADVERMRTRAPEEDSVKGTVVVDGSTALHLAAAAGCVGVVETLLQADADVNKARASFLNKGLWNETMIGDGSSPLHLGAAAGSLGVVKALINAGCEVNQIRVTVVRKEFMNFEIVGDASTALHLAAAAGCVGAVETLLQAGAEVDKTRATFVSIGRSKKVPLGDSSTALHLGAEGGSVQVVQALLKAGAAVDKIRKILPSPPTAPAPKTALMLAASFGHVKVMNTLVLAGATVCSARLPFELFLNAARKSTSSHAVRFLQKIRREAEEAACIHSDEWWAQAKKASEGTFQDVSDGSRNDAVDTEYAVALLPQDHEYRSRFRETLVSHAVSTEVRDRMIQVVQEWSTLARQRESALCAENKQVPGPLAGEAAIQIIEAAGAIYAGLKGLENQSNQRMKLKLEHSFDGAIGTFQRLNLVVPRELRSSPGRGSLERMILAHAKFKHEKPEGASLIQLLGGLALTGNDTAEVLDVYFAKRTEETKDLAVKILDDVRAYGAGMEKLLAEEDGREAQKKISELVRAREKREKNDSGMVAASRADAADVDAPPHKRLSYISHMRQMAVLGSIELYRLVCEAVAGQEAEVQVGMVKKVARLVFKSTFKYNCQFEKVRDVNRCTIVVETLEQVHRAFEAVLKDQKITVVRVKNRFDANSDNAPIGGYCDLQLQVGFEVLGQFMMGEVQINVREFVKLKARKGGGHEIFDYARTIMAYDPSTFIYKGALTESVLDMIGAGSILDLDVSQQCKGVDLLKILAGKLKSKTCRVTELKLESNEIGDEGAGVIAEALKVNESLRSVGLERNYIGHTGAVAIAEALKVKTAIRTERFQWLLFWACERGKDIDIVARLLKGAPVCMVDKTKEDGQSLVYVAAHNGHLNVVRFLAEEAKADCNRADNRGQTPIFVAAENGHLDVVRFLVEEVNVDVDKTNRDGLAPIHGAASNGHLDVVRFLVETAKAIIDILDRYKRSPLYFGVLHGHLNVVRFLVQDGRANASETSTRGLTPILVATQNGDVDTVQFLVEAAHVDPSKTDIDRRWMPLHMAARDGHLGLVRYLVEDTHVDPEKAMHNGETPLYIATSYGHLDIVRYLVEEAKVDPNKGSYCGETPIYVAAKKDHLDTVRYFVESAKVDINKGNNRGETPIYVAAHKGHLDVVRYLVEVGKVDYNKANKDGRTPLDIVTLRNNTAVADYLRSIIYIYEIEMRR